MFTANLVGVNRDESDVLEVARNLGSAVTFQQDMTPLFGAKFEEAVHTVAARFGYDQLQNQQDDFIAAVKDVIGRDLNGYHLEDVVVQEVSPTEHYRLALGQHELRVEWLEVKRGIRLADLISEHLFSAVARRQNDGTMDYVLGGDAELSPGERLAVAVRSERYEALKAAVS